MADAGGSKASKLLRLPPKPEPGARERAAEYESNRLNNIELDRLRKQRDTIVANLAVGDESGIIGEINVLHQDRDELQKLKPQVASLEKIKDIFLEEDIDAIILAIQSKDAQIVKLPALQAASDKLEAVAGKLGPGVDKEVDIAGIVGKMLDDNLAFRNQTRGNTLKLAANDTEIARLMALTAEQKKTIDGYILTAREQTTALELKVKENELYKRTSQRKRLKYQKLEQH